MLTVSRRLNVSCAAFCTEMARYRCNDDCHLQITAKFANRSHASRVWCLIWYGKINAACCKFGEFSVELGHDA